MGSRVGIARSRRRRCSVSRGPYFRTEARLTRFALHLALVPRTAPQLAICDGCDPATARAAVKLMVARKLVHVGDWVIGVEGGRPTAQYHAGPGAAADHQAKPRDRRRKRVLVVPLVDRVPRHATSVDVVWLAWEQRS